MANELAMSEMFGDELKASLGDKVSALSQSLIGRGLAKGQITAFFDACGLSCPMPLLKAKVALRTVADGCSLYLIASDKNSQTDLVAFCQKQGLDVQTWTEDDHHFIITKKPLIANL